MLLRRSFKNLWRWLELDADAAQKVF